MRTGDVGIVETLDVAGQFGQMKVFLNGGEGAHGALLGVEFFHHFELVGAVLLGIFERNGEQFALVAALWHHKFDAFGRELGHHVHERLSHPIGAIDIGKTLPKFVNGGGNQF